MIQHELPSGRHTGWNPSRPDHRDYFYALRADVRTGPELPSSSLIPATQQPPIWNQLDIGSCTAHGTLRAFLTACTRLGLPATMLSRLEQYWNSRALEGTTSTDSGASVRDAMTALFKDGCGPESEWPYDTAKFADKPPTKVTVTGEALKGMQYQSVQNAGPGAPMRTALANRLPIVFGFTVPSFFENTSVWDPSSGEPLPLPGPDDEPIGGHCVCATGYDFSGKFVSTPTTSRSVPDFFTCANSWDDTWGMAGFFNVDARYFSGGNPIASDLWVVTKVS